MPERNRDQSVEHVLRRVLSKEVPQSSQGACLDGETLAAWTEGSLRADEAAVVERHVTDCARCRALMAAFIQTTPPTPAVESVWRRWRLGWVVPLATAATAAALWITLPGSSPTPFASNQEVAEVAVDAARPDAVPPPAPSTAPPASIPPSAVQEKAAATARNEFRRRVNESEARGQLLDERAAADAALSQRIEVDRRENAITSAPQSIAAARQASVPVEIVAPGGSARWRIINGQQVEWSSSSATDWSSVALTSPDLLAAGAAPSTSVCWIVGRRGAVYLTTDGARFMRLPFPETVDLVSVTALNDRAATVSAADGRAWETTDQGLTWSISR